MSKPSTRQAVAFEAPHPADAFLAADIGGTNARLALVRPGSLPHNPAAVLRYANYKCAEWPGLLAAFRHFVQETGASVQHCVIASAGYVLGDEIVNRNLPWPVSLSELRRGLNLRHLEAVNDFEAITYAARFVTSADTVPIVAGDGTQAGNGPLLVMGPGTGFGMAALLDTAPRPRVLPTEAGQLGLAPGTDLELDILRMLQTERGRVCYDDALSGPGLLRLYLAICRLHGAAPLYTQPESVTRAAMIGSDPQAACALDVFCGLLGSLAGDLALAYRARGVYLAGGILPNLRPLLEQGRFRSRFLDKGVMRPFLEKIDVQLMEHGRWGVIGAAGLFLDGLAG